MRSSRLLPFLLLAAGDQSDTLAELSAGRRSTPWPFSRGRSDGNAALEVQPRSMRLKYFFQSGHGRQSTFGLEQESSRRTDEEPTEPLKLNVLRYEDIENEKTHLPDVAYVIETLADGVHPVVVKRVFSELQDLHKALKGVLRVKTKLPPKKFFISLSIEGTCIVGECWV